MPRCTITRWISSPVETVFASIQELRESFAAVSYLRVIDWPHHTSLGVGVTGVLRAGRRELALRISTYAENRVLEFEVTEGPYVTRQRLEFEWEMGGTRITHTTETTVCATRIGRTRLPPTRRAIDHMIGSIKAKLEAANTSLAPVRELAH